MDPKNLYKLLNVAAPSLVLLQLRPELILKKFNMHPSKVLLPDEQVVFDESAYIAQLMKQGHELTPTYKMRVDLRRELRKGKFVLSKQPQGITEEEAQEREKRIMTYRDFSAHERVQTKAIALLSLWAEQHGAPVVLADLPDSVHRTAFCVRNSTSQVEEIFRTSIREMVLDP